MLCEGRIDLWLGADYPTRPNGPAEPSPGHLRPEADALGRKRTATTRPEGPREIFLEAESARSDQVLATLQAAGLWDLLTQGIGLRPQPLGWILATRWAAKSGNQRVNPALTDH